MWIFWNTKAVSITELVTAAGASCQSLAKGINFHVHILFNTHEYLQYGYTARYVRSM